MLSNKKVLLKMKILYDHQIFLLQKYGGISRYFAKKASKLLAMQEEVQILAPVYQNEYLDSLPANSVIGLKVPKAPSKLIFAFKGFNQNISKHYARHLSPNIVHETYYDNTYFPVPGAARFLTVYDMIHERFPDLFPQDDKTTHKKRLAVARADHIIAISLSAKQDLCEFFNIPEEKVTVVHLGFEKFKYPNPGEMTIVPERPFLLYVGNRSGYKNFEGMLRAVAADSELRDAFDVVAFGGSKFKTEEMALFENLGLRPGSVRQLNGSDAQLGVLYKNARAFVYPSYYEGFGLPPLEAMAQHCPVVVSNTSSIPEVVGNAGEYFTPSDCEEQTHAIRNVVFNEARRDELVARGHERLKQFSWHRCASETRDIYRKVF